MASQQPGSYPTRSTRSILSAGTRRTTTTASKEKELNLVPTQEERLTTLEKTVTTFQKETTTNIREIEENTTILLGVIRSQGRDIKRIFEQLETMDQRLEQVETRLDEHTTLLKQILARLPERPS